MIGKIIRFGRRQLHTITSREIIKPLSPTPSHRRTYNLSQLDQAIPHIFSPMILFYPNDENCGLTPDDKAQKLKKSLSHSLTRYYPFAGKLHTPTSPYIDCNDEGVVFVEAKHDCTLNKFQNKNYDNLTSGNIFADDMVWQTSTHNTSLVGVQLNHFTCGGLGLAVSLSHKVADGCTIGSYLNHWASVARYGSADHKQVQPLNPHFIQFPAIDLALETSAFSPASTTRVTRKFVFPNSKLSELKNKVLTLAKSDSGSTLSINNPTRIEALASLIYKTVVSTRSDSSKPYYLFIPKDMRNDFVPKLPRTTVGNFVTFIMVTATSERETSLTTIISEIKKQKMELKNVQSMEQATKWLGSCLSSLGNEDIETIGKRTIWGSSFCGFGFNKVDFGWGNPSVASLSFGGSDRNGFLLMDAPNGDGIEARVTLESQDMDMFQNNKELLSFCKVDH